jgi:hypothetical protein
MVFHQAERIGGGEFGQMRLLILPFVDWPFERRAQHAFVAQAWRSAEPTQLAAVNRDCLVVAQPRRLSRFVHYMSFCERCERIAVLVHDLVSDLHRALKIGIVRQNLESTASELDHVQLLPTFQIEALHELARQDQPVRIPDLSDFNLHATFVLNSRP